MNLSSLKIGQRLGLSFSIVMALLLALATLSYRQIIDLDEGINLTNEDRYPKTVLAHTIKDELNEVARNLRNVLIMGKAEDLKSEYENMEESARVITKAIDGLNKTVTSPEGLALMAKIAEVRARFLTGRGSFIALAKDGKRDEAVALLLSELRPTQRVYMGELDKLIELQNRLMTSSAHEAEADVKGAKVKVLALSLAALVISILVTYFATRSITTPLLEAVGVARRVADGDLTSDISVEAQDETGQLMQALKEMNDSLLKIVSQVRNGTESMASGSRQIAIGNLDLSSRTEQQASSLEETASSMEEMTSTVKQNGENARQANTLAKSASQVAIKGGAVVSQVVVTMGAINESSRKIVDIISVIDGIAFQTNILALNAAVEAARAGEQGRGFAVVASEVRNLAQRSAAAAKEIKVLIGDSVEKIDFGSKLVGDAGSTMQEIVASVQRVTDIMGEITTASREQEAGIEQINQAVTEMDTVTQQNAALVEEAAAAAAALQEQASQLAEAVSVFKIHDLAMAQRPTRANVAPLRMSTRREVSVVAAAPHKGRVVAASRGDWEGF
ncbi:methyl-accepting chemotaxis protein [Duganella sp. S19_KUP01_CR8]|uniref:methyl-accepting chemotaxis protein n=1 Tax=Duganella sp. S19_KUP01_CR8 TaxID=3025502 RepID=UPI002FCD901B